MPRKPDGSFNLIVRYVVMPGLIPHPIVSTFFGSGKVLLRLFVGWGYLKRASSRTGTEEEPRKTPFLFSNSKELIAYISHYESVKSGQKVFKSRQIRSEHYVSYVSVS